MARRNSTVKLTLLSAFNDRGTRQAESALRKFRERTGLADGDTAVMLAQSGIAMQQLGGKISAAGAGMTVFGGKLTRGVTLPLGIAAGAATKAAVDFESSFAGVIKTVAPTADEIRMLQAEARNLAKTQIVDVNEVNRVMELGGQLGIATDMLGAFSKTVTGLDVATNMDIETAATQLAQFSNITGMAQTNTDKLGSVIVELGNKSATTEADIMNMAMRIAGSGRQIGLTEAQIMGMAAALSSVGIEAEAGGTAVSVVMSEVDKAVAFAGETIEDVMARTGKAQAAATAEWEANQVAVEAWASAAGMSVEQFVSLWEQDAGSALESLFTGLGDASNEGENLNLILDELGITSIRQTDMMKRMAGASDLMGDSIATANKAWDENVALQKEVAAKNDTTAQKLEQLRIKAYDAAITAGRPLADALIDVVDASEPLIKAVSNLAQGFADLPRSQQETIIKMVAFAAAAGPVISVLGRVTGAAGAVVGGIGSMTQHLATFSAAAAGNGAQLTGWAANLGNAAAKFPVLGGAAASAATALGGMIPVVGAVGLAVGGLALASKARDFVVFGDASREAGVKLDETNDHARALGDAMQNVTPQVTDFTNALSDKGNTLAEIDATIQQAEQGITDILAAALKEQRALRDEDLAAIDEYNQQIADKLQEKVDTYITTMEAGADAVVAAGETLSVEQQAQELANIEATQVEIRSAIEAGYQQRLALVAQEHQQAGTVNSEGYDNDIASVRQWKTDRLAELEQAGNESVEKITQAGQNFSREGQAAIGGAMDAINAITETRVRTSNNHWESLENGLSSATGNMHDTIQQAKIDYESALASMDVEGAKSLFSMMSAHQEAGITIPAASQGTAAAILAAYDNLPPELEDSGRESLLSLVAGMEENMGLPADTADMSAQEIVNAIKEHYDLTETGAQFPITMSEGISSRWSDVSSASEEMVRLGIDPTIANMRSTLIPGQTMGDSFAQGISSRSDTVSKSGSDISNAAQTGIDSKTAQGAPMGTKMVSGFYGALLGGIGLTQSAASDIAGASTNMGNYSGESAGWGRSQGSAFASALSGQVRPTRSAANAIASESTRINSNSGSTYTWGSHFAANFASGLRGGIRGVRSAASAVAAAARSILGFTVPDEGPLSDADEYGPHFIDLLTEGMIGGIPDIKRASTLVALAARPHMEGSLDYGMTSGTLASGAPARTVRNVTINIAGITLGASDPRTEQAYDVLKSLIPELEQAEQGNEGVM